MSCVERKSPTADNSRPSRGRAEHVPPRLIHDGSGGGERCVVDRRRRLRFPAGECGAICDENSVPPWPKTLDTLLLGPVLQWDARSLPVVIASLTVGASCGSRCATNADSESLWLVSLVARTAQSLKSPQQCSESSVGCKLWLRKKNSTRVGRRTLAPSSAFCHDSGGIDCASNVGRIPNHSDQAWRAVHRELNDGEGETCCFSLALRPGALPSYQPRQKCAD
ncbi:hypothetical protein PF007_g28796 [Phytophthora fragariae]|uniref:Uncharacterized protein n=1 Tax=Phytophthora fragariae TaxID=53985 RepID=A0A6A3PZE8_9STRA|nr:hypothetical protein PF007_g28796 [Phytophthora fragariae]